VGTRHFSKSKGVRERKSLENTDIESSSVSTSDYRFFAMLCCHVYQLPYIVKRRMKFSRIKYLFMIKLRIGESISASSMSLLVF